MLVAVALAAIAPVTSASSAPAPDAAERRAVLAGISSLINDCYVDPKRGAKIASAIGADARLDRFSRSVSAEDFAKRVTTRLREVSGDGHFVLERRKDATTPADEEAADLEKWYGAQVNHGFERVDRLAGGVGYLDLRVFAPVSMGGDLAIASMNLLAQSPAIIIDLRQNGGGFDDMTRLLAAYLFDDVQEMSGVYDRPAGTTTRLFTPSLVEGRRFGARKPVYILVSRQTFSAAEAFAYDLQALKRATIIGERTGGGAHPFEFREAGRNYRLGLPEKRSINPVTRSDWEGIGVIPDVPTKAEDALDRALEIERDRAK